MKQTIEVIFCILARECLKEALHFEKPPGNIQTVQEEFFAPKFKVDAFGKSLGLLCNHPGRSLEKNTRNFVVEAQVFFGTLQM